MRFWRRRRGWIRVKNWLSILFMRFWERTCSGSGTPNTFNSLYEIQSNSISIKMWMCFSFNSLYEIPRRTDQNHLAAILLFQFSLWDSRKRINRKNNTTYKLSILFMRFLQKHNHEYNTNKNFQFSLWDSKQRRIFYKCSYNLSILFMRFRYT